MLDAFGGNFSLFLFKKNCNMNKGLIENESSQFRLTKRYSKIYFQKEASIVIFNFIFRFLPSYFSQALFVKCKQKLIKNYSHCYFLLTCHIYIFSNEIEIREKIFYHQERNFTSGKWISLVYLYRHSQCAM